MKLYLKTRSTDIDYNWVKINSNSASVEPMFISDAELEFQKSISDFEKITFWAESSLNNKLFLCFCGIPTNRKDNYGRLIRANIVVETTKGISQNNEKLLNIIKFFIDLIKNNNLIRNDKNDEKEEKESLPENVINNSLSKLINNSLRKEEVDPYLLLTIEIKKLKRTNPNDKRIGEYNEKLNKINLTLSEEDFLTSVEYKDNKPNNYSALDNQSHYYGDITDDKSYYQFLKSLEEMLFGTKYYKIVTICNNKSDKNELADILKQEKEQCVLLGKFDNFNHNGMIPVKIGAKKKSVGCQENVAPKTQNTRLYPKPNNYHSRDESSIPLRQTPDSDIIDNTYSGSSEDDEQDIGLKNRNLEIKFFDDPFNICNEKIDEFLKSAEENDVPFAKQVRLLKARIDNKRSSFNKHNSEKDDDVEPNEIKEPDRESKQNKNTYQDPTINPNDES